MLKIKITAVLLLIIIVGAFAGLKTASQTRTDENSKIPQSRMEKVLTTCQVEAYRRGTANDDLKKTIIYSRPDDKSKIVKTVAANGEVVYTLSDSNDKGWFKITKITEVEETDDVIFAGSGWISASSLDLSIAASDPNLRAAPDKRSRVVEKLIPDESEARPLACRGDWMKIKSGGKIGWLSREGQCANPLTTCP